MNGGGFKTRKIPRELMLDPGPPRRRWWLWLVVVVVVVVGALVVFNAAAPI